MDEARHFQVQSSSRKPATAEVVAPLRSIVAVRATKFVQPGLMSGWDGMNPTAKTKAVSSMKRWKAEPLNQRKICWT
eukprot:2168679-Karenia_brevis.AAC.1